mgnify:CR=1 FL=1
MNLSADDMNEMTVTSDGPVILSVRLTDDCHCILYVFTPPHLRGTGLMRKMFGERMAWADKRDMRLLLLLSPDDDTDKERLRAFYEEHGFEFGEGYAISDHGLRVPKSEREESY